MPSKKHQQGLGTQPQADVEKRTRKRCTANGCHGQFPVEYWKTLKRTSQ